jgi:hypothetical protein
MWRASEPTRCGTSICTLAGSIYRSGHVGTAQPPTGEGFAFNVRGVAPYWRVAWQQNGLKNNFEIGTYGMHLKSSFQTITGPEDSYTDWAADFQYDRALGKDHCAVRTFEKIQHCWQLPPPVQQIGSGTIWTCLTATLNIISAPDIQQLSAGSQPVEPATPFCTPKQR